MANVGKESEAEGVEAKIGSEVPEPEENSRTKKALAFFGAVAFGVSTNGLWELVAKPGGQWFLTLISLGSDSFRDQAYESAALDPTPIPALLTLFAVLTVPALGLLGGVVGLLLADRRRNLADEELTKTPTDKQLQVMKAQRAALKARLGMMKRVVKWAALGLALNFAFSVVQFARHNQSTLIWRRFHNNLARMAGCTTLEQSRAWTARFAAMKTRADYQAIDSDMRAHAARNALQLPPNDLW